MVEVWVVVFASMWTAATAGDGRVELRPGLPAVARGWAAFVQDRLDAGAAATDDRVRVTFRPEVGPSSPASVRVSVRVAGELAAARAFALDAEDVDIWLFVRSALERWRRRSPASPRAAEAEAPAAAERGPWWVHAAGAVRSDLEVGGRVGLERDLRRLRLAAAGGYGYARRDDALDRHRLSVVTSAGWAVATSRRFGLRIGTEHRVDAVHAVGPARSVTDVSLGAGGFAALRVFAARRAFAQLRVAGIGYYRRQAFDLGAVTDREPPAVFEVALGFGWAP